MNNNDDLEIEFQFAICMIEKNKAAEEFIIWYGTTFILHHPNMDHLQFSTAIENGVECVEIMYDPFEDITIPILFRMFDAYRLNLEDTP